ncbi:ribokinase [Aldersonia sp. NBC_00410]|uniref:ribokinase n=1 Tax=Aldersonia sp. NBC_00410 TaxID=2975954 RepID=UPI002256D2A9|nr:ribokinase [Aldersonia sp. NBC_00410]MCX5042771.1 ribokinase [Aldersonia sp. NBC_00410]
MTIASGDPVGPAITVVGSVNMDLVATVSKFPAPGETLLGTGFAATPGGKGANQAIAAARAGAQVEFIGAVGDDTFALDLRQTLVDDEVGTSGLREVGGPSGVALITVDSAGENTIVVAGNANTTLTELTDADLHYIAAADIVMCQLELPLSVVIACLQHARRSRTTTMLNCSPVQALPDDLVAAVDVLVLNAGESAQVGAEILARIPQVVTTLGAHGARYRGQDGSIEVSAVEVDVVDTTGAGDAFAGALATFWPGGPEPALRAACVAGALATTRSGAVAALPQRAEIEALLRCGRNQFEDRVPGRLGDELGDR